MDTHLDLVDDEDIDEISIIQMCKQHALPMEPCTRFMFNYKTTHRLKNHHEHNMPNSLGSWPGPNRPPLPQTANGS
jgi:hypothetical protein